MPLIHQKLGRQSGFTLIEVLVAVVVLAFGLLGLAGLQVLQLRYNQSAYFRSQATQLAYDIADRMRANMPGVTAGEYDEQAGSTDDCENQVCDPPQMAGYDLTKWGTAIAAQLPNGQGVVCIDATPNDDPAATPDKPECDHLGAAYAIKIWWADTRADSANQQFVMSFQP